MASEMYARVLNDALSRFNAGAQNGWVANYHGTATTFQNANAYANACGQSAGNALLDTIPDALANNDIGLNEAQRIIGEVMKASGQSAGRMAEYAQEGIIDGLGVDLNVIPADRDKMLEMIKNLVTKYGEYEDPTQADFLLTPPTQKVYTKSIVSDTQRRNADFLASAGFSVKINRVASPDCCEWCSDMAGSYTKANAPKDVWRFHRDCPCYIDYEAGKTKSRVSFITNEDGSISKVVK